MIKILKYNVLIASMLTLSVNVSAQVYLELDTNAILIGEQINLHAEFVVGESIDSCWVISREGPLEVLELRSEIGEEILIANATITAWDTGMISHSPLEFIALGRNTQTDTFPVPDVQLFVTTVAIDTAVGIYDIKAPVDAPFSIGELLPELIYVLIGVIVLFVLLYFLLFRRKKLQELTNARIDPLEKALASLQNLEDESLWEKGAIKEHYDRLSDTVRLFLEDKLEVRALEMTTGQIEDHRRIMRVPPATMALLKPLLNASDLAKFAKGNPGPQMHLGYLENARRIVRDLNDQQNDFEKLTEE